MTAMNTEISSNNHTADVYRVHTMCQALFSKSLLWANHHNSKEKILLSLFYQWVKWTTESLSNFPKVTVVPKGYVAFNKLSWV